MVTILLQIEESLLHRILTDASASHISAEEQIIKLLNGSVETPTPMNDQVALETALERARAREVGNEFTLEDLFSDEEWDQIPARRVFGRVFRQAIEGTDPQVARHERKTPANKAVYRRL